MEDQMKQEYHDWVTLLNKTDNRDLLRANDACLKGYSCTHTKGMIHTD